MDGKQRLLPRRLVAVALQTFWPNRNYRCIAAAPLCLFDAVHGRTGKRSKFRVVEHSASGNAWLLRDTGHDIAGPIWDSELNEMVATSIQAYPGTSCIPVAIS